MSGSKHMIYNNLDNLYLCRSCGDFNYHKGSNDSEEIMFDKNQLCHSDFQK